MPFTRETLYTLGFGEAAEGGWPSEHLPWSGWALQGLIQMFPKTFASKPHYRYWLITLDVHTLAQISKLDDIGPHHILVQTLLCQWKVTLLTGFSMWWWVREQEIMCGCSLSLLWPRLPWAFLLKLYGKDKGSQDISAQANFWPKANVPWRFQEVVWSIDRLIDWFYYLFVYLYDVLIFFYVHIVRRVCMCL